MFREYILQHKLVWTAGAGPSWDSPPFLSCSEQLSSSFWFHLVMLCAGLTYAGPAQRAEGSHFSSGSKSADELILMKELDAVGDALEGLLLGGWGVAPRARGNRCCSEDESPGSFILVKFIQIFGVLALADSLLPLPVTVWEPRLSGSNARPVSW